MFLIYRLISPSGKSYIGLTSQSFETRFNGHLREWKGYRKCKKLYNAFDKYNPLTMWNHEILYTTDNKNTAEQEEIQYIKLYDSIENGYNILPGGNLGFIGMHRTEETKRKLSIINKIRGIKPPSRKGVKLSKEHIRKRELTCKINGTRKRSRKKGRKLSEEHKQKISIANKGYKLSDETKLKISSSRKGMKYKKQTKV